MAAPVKSYELTATQRMLPDLNVFKWCHHCQHAVMLKPPQLIRLYRTAAILD